MENHFKNVFGVYDGLHTDTLRHIPEISFYNHNYYIGLKRGNSTIHDLLFAVSNVVLPELSISYPNSSSFFRSSGVFLRIKHGVVNPIVIPPIN